jgi:hypothetical protein
VERVHDLIGNIVMTTLVLAIWLMGKVLSEPARTPRSFALGWEPRLRRLGRYLWQPASPFYAALTIATLVGIFAARMIYARAEAQVHTQTAPRFVARLDESRANRVAPIPREVWNELRPTSGEYVRNQNFDGPGGGDCFHFFWKPSVWNRFALVHRPDICMPGIGWELDGAPQPLDTEIDGRVVRFYLFRFRRGDARALELWGAWRNGDPVPVDYSVAQVFGKVPPPASLQFEGKRRSATEIVACSVIAQGSEPAVEIAVALLRSVFHYKSDD